ncbi:MAG TPA: hypothetical protein V6D29_16515 [Leptolyngbyaceae cyanobacterium]
MVSPTKTDDFHLASGPSASKVVLEVGVAVLAAHSHKYGGKTVETVQFPLGSGAGT